MTNEHAKYLVAQRKDGKWECSCPHYIFRGRVTGDDCKHIKYVKEHIGTLIPAYDVSNAVLGQISSTLSNTMLEDVPTMEDDLFVYSEEDEIYLTRYMGDDLDNLRDGVQLPGERDPGNEISEDEDEFEFEL